MKITPVKGTNDYLPAEAALREYMQGSILGTYINNGFERILTPALEDIENLDKSDGGDNLNLLFKILKRGDKLNAAIENNRFDSLSDIGLRYDLTLPLSRYYANNRANLIFPMKCIQIGNAYRAENPQKGRYREFTQCDIDILGISSYWAEAELIVTTSAALLNIGINDFRVRINDRRILKDLFINFDFSEEQIPALCVIFDKMDKIGASGVEHEINQKAFDEKACSRLVEYINQNDFSLEKYINLVGKSDATDNIESIINTVNQLSGGEYRCDFDISLVRGQGYYTGAVFEIESLEYSSSVAGGGRYDDLIGKFINEKIPAVGFSIGFERIFDILTGKNFEIPGSKQKIAVIFEEDYACAYNTACGLKIDYLVSIFEKPKKLGKFLDKLQNDGYSGFCYAGEAAEINLFENNNA